jgi:hypothetical protein
MDYVEATRDTYVPCRALLLHLAHIRKYVLASRRTYRDLPDERCQWKASKRYSSQIQREDPITQNAREKRILQYVQDGAESSQRFVGVE